MTSEARPALDLLLLLFLHQGKKRRGNRRRSATTNAATAVAAGKKAAVERGSQAIQATGIATKAWTAAQWLLNAALDANPIGIVVMAIAALVGALIYAYNNSEEFRRIVDEAWAAVKELASVLWGVLKKSLDMAVKGFKAVVQWVKDFARWFSSTQLFQSISKFNTWVREHVVRVIERVIGATSWAASARLPPFSSLDGRKGAKEDQGLGALRSSLRALRRG